MTLPPIIEPTFASPEPEAFYLFEAIPFQVERAELLQRTHTRPESEDAADLLRLADEAEALAKPKAFYRSAYIDARSQNTITSGGITFTSRVMAVNLERAHRFFPYLATCGGELEAWAQQFSDMLVRYWADVIMLQAVAAARQALIQHIRAHHLPGESASMNPGSLEDWRIQEQALLFALLGAPAQRVGVRLTESMLMVPAKSVSGIRFAVEETFESCLLCPRQGCPGRRAAYDPGLYERRYQTR